MVGAVMAAAEAATEHSQSAFYVAGGAAAVIGVALALYGISRPSFPGTRGAERGVIALFAALVALAMVTSVATAS